MTEETMVVQEEAQAEQAEAKQVNFTVHIITEALTEDVGGVDKAKTTKVARAKVRKAGLTIKNLAKVNEDAHQVTWTDNFESEEAQAFMAAKAEKADKKAQKAAKAAANEAAEETSEAIQEVVLADMTKKEIVAYMATNFDAKLDPNKNRSQLLDDAQAVIDAIG